MEKLDVQIFREFRQEIIDKKTELIERGEYLSDEEYEQEYEQFLARYREIIEILSEHDLSDIDFEEWRGMPLSLDKDNPLDFSKTKANIDFSIIERYGAGKTFTNFKSCKIKNFNFEKYGYFPEMFDEEVRKENSEFFLSEEVPESVRKHYYEHNLSMQEFSENLQHFEGKTVAHFFRSYGPERKIISLYGESIYQLFADYKPIMDKLLKDYTVIESSIEVPTGPLTDEQRKEIMSSAITSYITRNGYEQIQSWDEFKMLLDFIPIEYLPEIPYTRELIDKYGIDRIIKSGIDIKCIFQDKKITSLEEISSIDGIELEDIKKLVDRDNRRVLDSYDVKQLLEYGIKDLSELSEITNDLYQIKKMLEKRPMDLINMGQYGTEKKEFIEKYGIDNIIAFDEETGGMFSHQIWTNDIYLTVFVLQEKKDLNLDSGKQLTYDEFKERMYQLLLLSRDEGGILHSGDFPDYDFIQGKFRDEHPEIFIDGDIDQEIKEKFYRGRMLAEDVRKNPKLVEILQGKDLSRVFTKEMTAGIRMQIRDNEGNVIKEVPSSTVNMAQYLSKKLGQEEFLKICADYGKYLEDVNADIFIEGQSVEERERAIQENIEENILNRKSSYDASIPEFFKKKHPEMFLDEQAPEELKKAFYDNKASDGRYLNISGDVIDINFAMIKEHPEWREFLQGKDLSRAFSREYSELFKRFDSSTLLKLGTRNPETIEIMVQNHREDLLESWYKSTGGKFVPHHVVMLNFPEGEIDSFLGNSKRWSQLMRIDNYRLNDEGKAAILKAAYAMGVFQGDNDGFNKTMKLFTDVPQELTQEEYEIVSSMLSGEFDPFWGSNFDSKQKEEEMRSLFEQAYTLNNNGKYVFSMDKQKNKDSVRMVREILEKARIPRILTPEKAHQMFDSFAMVYNPDFVRFFNDNIEEILSNPKYTKDIATIQRKFEDIVKTNAGRRLTLNVAQDYIKSIAYTDIEVGNEGVAEQAKIAGYPQEDFEAIQRLFDEGEVRDFSSIPRIQGSTKKGYTYEMLRCDDPLALTIGTLTDCCQEIHGAGQTSMEHSVVSPDGRVFCVRDAEGRLVAQSWFWRNQYTGCFDNIEIPNKIFQLYEKEHPKVGRKGLTMDVLEVYKKAAQDLMKEDARVYKELLENGTITQEQYDSLLLGKVTIGLGYNDIADAIQSDKTIHKETDNVGVRGTDRLPHPYTDASTQYTIAEREGTIKSEHENLYVHQDDVPVYDGTNMSSTVLLTMKRMEQSTERDNLAYLSERSDEENLPKSQRIINSIARGYGLNPNDTRVMATARIALIYSKDKDNKVKIGELLSSPLKTELTEEQKQKATAHIMYQIKKALKQIGVQDSELDLSSLSEEQQQMLQSVMKEIEKENDKRGER